MEKGLIEGQRKRFLEEGGKGLKERGGFLAPFEGYKYVGGKPQL